MVEDFKMLADIDRGTKLQIINKFQKYKSGSKIFEKIIFVQMLKLLINGFSYHSEANT